MANWERRAYEPFSWAEWSRGLAIAVAAGLFMAFSGAFATGQASLVGRLIYWVGVMSVGAVGGGLVARFIAGWTWFDDRPWPLWGAITLAIGLPFALVIWAVTTLMWGQPLKLAVLPWFFPPVLMISAIMTAINLLASRRPRETHAAPAGAEPVKFLDRVPLKLRGAEIWAVEAEDHYLRIHTDRGSDLILMRLSDAIGELEGIEGAQTHRSWWVAKAAVIDAARGDGRAVFTLKNGVEVPVSRTYAKVLRAEGWY